MKPDPGQTVRAAYAGATQPQPLYRAWNPTISGHFYTVCLTPVFRMPSLSHICPRATAQPRPVAGSVRLIQLYNAAAGEHFYTTNTTEANSASTGGGYVIEDKNPMYVYPTQLCGSVLFYRLFAGTYGDHFYTESAEERDGSETSGWV
ncbi:hypothetical protein B0H13DRAFT_1619369 [Mycena leptocephala]|nr:hypothetical protein B0H13DRAFT_1619369 [Mycena leptocephala]